MKSMALMAFGEPLIPMSLEVPEPGPGKVLEVVALSEVNAGLDRVRKDQAVGRVVVKVAG